MPHDATKVLLGTHGSSDYDASCENADPATFKAGLIVHRKTDGTLSLASADGSKIGVSMGISLSDTSKTSVCRSGNFIPVQITDETDAEAEPEPIGAFDYVVIGQPVESSATTGKAVSDGNATGAIWVSGPMKGIDPITKAEIDVALIDMGGGL
jgi:hypothetical protein